MQLQLPTGAKDLKAENSMTVHNMFMLCVFKITYKVKETETLKLNTGSLNWLPRF